MTDSTDTSDLTPDGDGTPMGEAVGSLSGADWESHDRLLIVPSLSSPAGENPFSELVAVLDSGSYSEWSEVDIKDALRRALNEYDG